MSYKRALPRDLFNESSLLKCLGRVALLIEDGMAPEGLKFEHTGEHGRGNGFQIDQSPSSGDICCLNLILVTEKSGLAHVWRSLNSRSKWPIHVGAHDSTEISVLDDEGNFTPEFLEWAKGEVQP